MGRITNNRDVEFIHCHSSGRFDQAPVHLEDTLDELMSYSDLITVTEVSDRARFNKLKEQGWDTSLPSGTVRDDCGIAWRLKEFPFKIFEETTVLSGKVYKNARGLTTRPQRGNFAIIEHKNRRKHLLVAVSHMPHGMAQELLKALRGKHPLKSDVAKTYMADFKAFKKHAKQLANRYNCDAMLLVCDFNIDIKRHWVRDWFDTYAPLFDVNWRKPYPKQGTLGKRIVDLTLYQGLFCIDRPRLLHRNEGEDHTPYKQKFRFRRL